ncbi:hypothetical protein like AT2G42760 [Hibiscus trionum]|uniref:DUF1685 family protein n=1 Tax=Hibiscus trionum TaxID=183268 RepID=A0A9W7HSE0_HIBTR|nr:hypothetical protein like AT2G42760 [Hibiscus trionum]
MESEEILNLFDSWWFELEIFKKQTSPSTPTGSEPNPDPRVEENPSKPELTRSPTLHTRSMSDQLSLISTSFMGTGSFSPDSVLHSPKLHKIISGKEVTEEDLQDDGTGVQEPKKKGVARMNSRRKKSSSKSLSDLEFEELKGFMDLGFVFSEEDNKDSRLVEIIPGLQRLGKKVEGDEEIKEAAAAAADDDRAEVPRPYLSEAWEVAETRRRRRKEKPLMNWRVPDLGNEIDMKDSLRLWAHTVASAVK